MALFEVRIDDRRFGITAFFSFATLKNREEGSDAETSVVNSDFDSNSAKNHFTQHLLQGTKQFILVSTLYKIYLLKRDGSAKRDEELITFYPRLKFG